MTPYWSDGTVTLHLGDCLDVLAGIEPASVDAVVTDPPYGLEFMGKEWDSFAQNARSGARADGGPSFGSGMRYQEKGMPAMRAYQRWCQQWAAECLRVLKPGGHLLAFGGTRTWHRLACGIEDAGFEIRDSVADLTGRDGPGLLWVYGSGFPKSLDVSKAIDKRPGVSSHREFAGHLAARRGALGLSRADVSERVVGTRTGACWNWEHHQFPEARWWPALRDLLGLDARWGAVIAEADREVVGQSLNHRDRPDAPSAYTVQQAGGSPDITAPATAEAARWEGWGTALKPAWEPIVVARKPLAGTVAGNVTEHGTGALNVDGCRVGDGSDKDDERWYSWHRGDSVLAGSKGMNTPGRVAPRPSGGTQGRWPPNVLLGPEAAAELDRQSGTRPGFSSQTDRSAYTNGNEVYGKGVGNITPGFRQGFDDTGGASRFFPVFRYEAKAPASERPRGDDGTAHPTVKPVDLMAWLVRLVTPPGGLVADPFAGSGTTAEACIVEGFRCVLIEKDPAYAALIRARLRKDIQPAMFGS